MITRYVLFFLLVLTLYIGYVDDKKKETEQLINQLKIINTKIANNETLIKQKENILTKIKRQEEISRKNRSKLFPPTINDSLIFGKVQQYIKNICNDIGVDLVSSNWGEVIRKSKYKKIPVSFIIRIYPHQLTTFFNKLYSYEKFLKIDSIMIGNYKSQKLVINFIVSAYKLENKK